MNILKLIRRKYIKKDIILIKERARLFAGLIF